MDAQERIKQQVTGNPVVLYMKGTPQFPQCGFSANAVQILKACGVEQVFTVNVLEEPEIRQGIKEYAKWPTIPQLYVNGEFVVGSEIMRKSAEQFGHGKVCFAVSPINCRIEKHRRAVSQEGCISTP